MPVCVICGKEFEAPQKRYPRCLCSDECRRIRKVEQNRGYAAASRKPRAEAKQGTYYAAHREARKAYQRAYNAKRLWSSEYSRVQAELILACFETYGVVYAGYGDLATARLETIQERVDRMIQCGVLPRDAVVEPWGVPDIEPEMITREEIDELRQRRRVVNQAKFRAHMIEGRIHLTTEELNAILPTEAPTHAD